MSLEFEWDEDKAASNSKKHRVTFEEAATVFADPLAAIFDDEAHSQEEQREIIIGHSADNHLFGMFYGTCGSHSNRQRPSCHEKGASRL